MELNRMKRDDKKRQKQQAKLQRQSLLKSKKVYNEAWSVKAIGTCGEKLHALIKANTSMQTWKSPYCGFPPPICKENQRRAIARRRAKRKGENISHFALLLEVSKPWLIQASNLSLFHQHWQHSSGFVFRRGNNTPVNSSSTRAFV